MSKVGPKIDITVVQIINLSDGRDKYLKVVQYLFKLFLWYFPKIKFPSSNLQFANAKIKVWGKVLSEARRVFRIGNWWRDLSSFRSGIANKELNYVELSSNVFGMLSCIFDDISFVGMITEGKMTSRLDQIDRLGNICWTTGIVFDIVVILRKMEANTLALKSESNQTEEKQQALQKVRHDTVLAGLKLVADFGFAFSYSANLPTPPLILILCGLVASSIGTLRLWNKYNQ
jgi:hypothetical protein